MRVVVLLLAVIGPVPAASGPPSGPAVAEATGVAASSPTAAPKSPGSERLDSWDKITSIADKVVKIAALLVGAVFAYVKFFKGRTFRPRLESTVTGAVHETDGVRYVVATAKVKNVGLTKCGIRQEGSGVGISVYQGGGKWNLVRVVSVLEHHRWIESGETVCDEVLVELDGGPHIAYKLELRLVSEERTWMAKQRFPWIERARISWLMQSIVDGTSARADGPKPDASVAQRGQEGGVR